MLLCRDCYLNQRASEIEKGRPVWGPRPGSRPPHGVEAAKEEEEEEGCDANTK